MRQRFEAWISAPPFEHMCDKNSENSAWPGTYKRYETELAWEAWQAAWAEREPLQAELAATRARLDKSDELLRAEFDRGQQLAQEVYEVRDILRSVVEQDCCQLCDNARALIEAYLADKPVP